MSIYDKIESDAARAQRPKAKVTGKTSVKPNPKVVGRNNELRACRLQEYKYKFIPKI